MISKKKYSLFLSLLFGVIFTTISLILFSLLIKEDDKKIEKIIETETQIINSQITEAINTQTFKIDKLFNKNLDSEINNKYQIFVYDDNQLIYNNSSSIFSVQEQFKNVDIL